MMDYRPSLTPEEQRKLELLRHASYNTAPRESTRIERLPPPQQAMISPSELSRLSLANIEARMASQGALAARVQAAQQAHAQAQVQNMQMMGRPQLSPALLSKHRLAFHPSSPIKQGQRPYSPQKQSVGGYRSPMRQPTYYRSQNEFSSFPSPASSFLSPAEHAHAYPSPASFPSSTTSFPSSAGSFPSSTGRIRSPAEGLNMLRAVSLGMRGDRSEGLPPMLAPPLTSHMAPPQSHPPPRHNSNASMDDMSTSTIHPSEGKLYIDELQPYDVLCGRGGKSNHHPGNKRYRHVVSEMKMMYRKTEAKAIKTDLSRAIVEHVCNYGGRFIKREENSGRYYVLTKSEARKKTSQALRETKELKWTA